MRHQFFLVRYRQKEVDDDYFITKRSEGGRYFNRLISVHKKVTVTNLPWIFPVSQSDHIYQTLKYLLDMYLVHTCPVISDFIWIIGSWVGQLAHFLGDDMLVKYSMYDIVILDRGRRIFINTSSPNTSVVEGISRRVIFYSITVLDTEMKRLQLHFIFDVIVSIEVRNLDPLSTVCWFYNAKHIAYET